MVPKIKNFVCYSFECDILPYYSKHSDIYVPMKCGDYASTEDLLSDKIGDSISEYNKYVNEMTLIWTIGKNIELFGDSEYLGISHYRRYLDMNPLHLEPNCIVCNTTTTSTFTLYQLYSIYHDKKDLDMFLSYFYKYFPEMKFDINEYLTQSTMYMCNLFIMHRRMFAQYFEFIEKCIMICINDMFPQLNLDARDKYQVRALSFILERMTGFWIWHRRKKCSVEIETVPIIVDSTVASIYQRTK